MGQEDDIGESKPLWTTVHGDLVTVAGLRNDQWVFHGDPGGDDGLRSGDPVPLQLLHDLKHVNDAAREYESQRAGDKIPQA